MIGWRHCGRRGQPLDQNTACSIAVTRDSPNTFQEIGQRYGPFDLGIFKVGAYGPSDYWHDVHVDPEEAIQGHLAIRGRRLLPVHWATFNLGLHDWDEPIKRAVRTAQEHNVDLVTPRLGEVVTIGQEFRSTPWWEDVK